MIMEEIEKKIRSFIISNFLFDSGADQLDNSASFLNQGIIDSTGVLELVEWIEEQFGFSVEDEELVPVNLDSVNNLAVFIENKINNKLNG
jgi:acyl carrier protein